MILVRQLEDLGVLMRLPHERSEELTLRSTRVRGAFEQGDRRVAPVALRRQDGKQLLRVWACAPESYKEELLTMWEGLAAGEESWKKLPTSVQERLDGEEELRLYEYAHVQMVWRQQARLARKAAKDELNVELVEGKAVRPICGGGCTRTGMAAHYLKFKNPIRKARGGTKEDPMALRPKALSCIPRVGRPDGGRDRRELEVRRRAYARKAPRARRDTQQVFGHMGPVGSCRLYTCRTDVLDYLPNMPPGWEVLVEN